jgi:hypothetical protein
MTNSGTALGDNRVIQGLWVGGELSRMEQLSLRSFLAHGHEYHLYAYDEIKNAPPGTVIQDADAVVSRKELFVIKEGWGKGSYGGGFSDFFRYELLRRKGGWWVDTDVVCLRPFAFAADTVIASSQEGKWGDPANGCVMKLPADGAAARFLSDAARGMDRDNLKYAAMGPHLVQRMVRELDLGRFVVPPWVFCPITWRALDAMVYSPKKFSVRDALRGLKRRARWLLRPRSAPGRIKRDSYAVHLWNEVWRQNNVDKNQTFSPRCLYEKLKRRYSV